MTAALLLFLSLFVTIPRTVESLNVKVEGCPTIRNADIQTLDLLQTMRNYRGTNQKVLAIEFKSGDLDFANYLTTLWGYAVPGLVLCGIACMFCVIFLPARIWCPAQVCRPTLKVSEYSSLQKMIPLLVWIVCGLIGVVFVVIGISTSERVSEGIRAVKCRVSSVQNESSTYLNTVESTITAFDGAMTTKAAWNSVKSSYQQQQNDGASSLTLSDICPPSSACSASDDSCGLPFFSKYSDICTASPISSYCTQDLRAEISGLYRNNFEKVCKTLKSLDNDFINTTAQSKLACYGKEANRMATEAKLMSSTYFPKVEAFFNTLENTVANYALVAGITLFSFFATSLAVGLVGMFLLTFAEWTNCTNTWVDKLDDVCGRYLFKSSFLLRAFGMTMMFFIVAVLLTIGVAINDVCYMLKDMQVTPTDYLSFYSNSLQDQYPSVGGNCSTPVRDQIISNCIATGGTFANISNFAEIESTNNIFSSLASFNSASWSSTSRLDAAITNWTTLGGAIATNASSLQTELLKYKAYAAKVFQNTSAMQTTMVPIVGELNTLKNMQSCNFLRHNYDTIEHSICNVGGLEDALLWICLALFICGCLGFPLFLCDVLFDIRIAGAGRKAVAHRYDQDEGEICLPPATLKQALDRSENEYCLSKFP